MELPNANKKSTEFRPKKIHEGIYNDDELSAEKTKTNSRTQIFFSLFTREWMGDRTTTIERINKSEKKFPKQVRIGNTQTHT